MNKVSIITAMTLSALEEKINNFGSTLEIVNASITKSDKLYVGCVVYSESIIVSTFAKPGKPIFRLESNNLRVYREFDGFRAVVATSTGDVSVGQGGGIHSLETIMIELVEELSKTYIVEVAMAIEEVQFINVGR